jgi:transposase
VVDGLGRPLAFVLTGGQAHDAPILPDLLGHPHAPLAVVADKAYDSQAVRQAIRDDGALPVIPARVSAKRPQAHDEQLYRLRNIVERFFCRCKDMRRIATRFDKLARNFLAALHLFAARLWLSY